MSDVTGRPHLQVCVKVNAPVDQGIAVLVEALNEFPALCTQSSCEGAAFVTFRFERPLQEQALFLCWLSRQIVGLASLCAEWGGRDSLVFTLRCPPTAVTSLSSLIEKTATAFQSLLYGSPCKESGGCEKPVDHRRTPALHDRLANPIADRMLLDLNS